MLKIQIGIFFLILLTQDLEQLESSDRNTPKYLHFPYQGRFSADYFNFESSFLHLWPNCQTMYVLYEQSADLNDVTLADEESD